MTTQGPGPVPTEGIGSNNSFGPPTAVGEWDMRQFAERAFRMLQGHSEPAMMTIGGPTLTDVEIIDDQGRMAYARCRAVGSGVEITVKANAGPLLVDPQADNSVDTIEQISQAAFESYWMDAGHLSPESYEKCAHAAFLAGLVAQP